MAETKEEREAREAAEKAAANRTAGSNAQPTADAPAAEAAAPVYKSVQDPKTGVWTRSL